MDLVNRLPDNQTRRLKKLLLKIDREEYQEETDRLGRASREIWRYREIDGSYGSHFDLMERERREGYWRGNSDETRQMRRRFESFEQEINDRTNLLATLPV